MPNSKSFYYCSKCNNAWGGESQRLKCPACGGKLVKTDYTEEEWDTFSQERKSEIKRQLKDENVDFDWKNDIIDIKRDVSDIRHDIHAMYTVLMLNVFVTLAGIGLIAYYALRLFGSL